jgi:AcrR family transcriptional regulator
VTSAADASAPRTARERVRVELTREIKNVARRHLAETGSSALSLRAVARDLGMVSSAVYRYFPSRDDLLTALIVDAYSAVGEQAEQAERAVRRGDYVGRWLATCRAIRRWAVAHPQEYALIFGSPVPGYRAPQDTVDPAARIPLLLFGVVSDAASAGRERPERPVPRAVRADLKVLRAQLAVDVSDSTLAAAGMGWSQLIGSISFELFGHLYGVIHDYEAYFDFQMREVAAGLGLS